MADWAQEYFERGYKQRWGLPPISDRVRLEVTGLCNSLNLGTGSQVVDIGCGHGRHAVALAQNGAKVVGVDVSSALLIEARHIAAQAGAQPHWVRGDMRRLPLRSGQFDGAILTDAFGFFESEEDNERVLVELARVVAPGRRVCVKVVNGAPILADFRSRDREERDGAVVTISRILTLNPPRMIEKMSVTGVRGSGEYERRQRLYQSEDMCALLERASFSIVAIYANANGEPFEPTGSPVMWLVCERVV